ncbi:hypothetical protein Aperf_G00000053784 [Anoplocephala perfoliata]
MVLHRRTTSLLIALGVIFYLGTISWHLHKNSKVLPTQDAKFEGLLNLSQIPWPEFPRPNSSRASGSLDIKMTVGQQKTLELLVEQFEQVMTSLHLNDQWFLNAGTLLGSLQHHDFIPWDDDADLMLHIRHRQTVQAALRNLSPHYASFNQDVRDKLYFHPLDKNANLAPTAVGSKMLPNYPWAWPSIDIAYYTEIGSNLGQEYHNPIHRFYLSDLRPFIHRPFGKHWYPAPRRPISFLKSYYKISKQICMSHSWSHVAEKPVKRKFSDCRKLMEKYPFVHRCSVSKWKTVENPPGLCDEYLVNGNGSIVHAIQTRLEGDECESLLFTVRHESFKCP